MKNGKKPTRAQKEQLAKRRLNAENWLVYKVLPTELHLVHRHTSTRRVMPIRRDVV